MKHMKGVVIAGKNSLAIRDDCPLPEEFERQLKKYRGMT